MVVNQLSLKFTDHYQTKKKKKKKKKKFRIGSLNRNSQGAVNLQLLLFTQNSISLEALHVCVIVRMPQIFYLLHRSN